MTSMIGSSGLMGSKAPKAPKGYKYGQMQNFTPEQMELFKQMFGDVDPESFLAQLAGGDEDFFNQMEAPALQQFSELQGGLASKFSGMGSGARGSSGFQNTMNQAASDFAQKLQSGRHELQTNAIKDLSNMRGQLLGMKPYENFLVQKQHKKSGLGGLLGSLLGGGAGFGLGGMGGAMKGAQFGYGVGSQF